MPGILRCMFQVTSAASVNLNLLSADFYALLVGLFVFKYTVSIKTNGKVTFPISEITLVKPLYCI